MMHFYVKGTSTSKALLRQRPSTSDGEISLWSTPTSVHYLSRFLVMDRIDFKSERSLSPHHQRSIGLHSKRHKSDYSNQEPGDKSQNVSRQPVAVLPLNVTPPHKTSLKSLLSTSSRVKNSLWGSIWVIFIILFAELRSLGTNFLSSYDIFL